MKYKSQFAVFLSVVLLFANSGLTLFAHTCLRSQHTSIQLTQNDECCSGEEETRGCCDKKTSATTVAEQHDNCCTVSLIHLEPNTKQLLPQQFSFVLEAVAIQNIFAVVLHNPATICNDFSITHSPPLPKGILQQTCLLRI
ncbi:MAG: hypothetical protein JNK66_12780 [Chitinophagales bacterium]|nr:hypothetical protein [Chitinophagales bacterium]